MSRNAQKSVAFDSGEMQTLARRQLRALLKPTLPERVFESIVKIVGSKPFVEVNLLWIGGWFIINFGLIPGLTPFDPFPFPMLMLILPCEALLIVLLTAVNGMRLRRWADKLAQLESRIEALDEIKGKDKL